MTTEIHIKWENGAEFTLQMIEEIITRVENSWDIKLFPLDCKSGQSMWKLQGENKDMLKVKTELYIKRKKLIFEPQLVSVPEDISFWFVSVSGEEIPPQLTPSVIIDSVLSSSDVKIEIMETNNEAARFKFSCKADEIAILQEFSPDLSFKGFELKLSVTENVLCGTLKRDIGSGMAEDRIAHLTKESAGFASLRDQYELIMNKLRSKNADFAENHLSALCCHFAYESRFAITYRHEICYS